MAPGQNGLLGAGQVVSLGVVSRACARHILLAVTRPAGPSPAYCFAACR
jgi:hypothetical protein